MNLSAAVVVVVVVVSSYVLAGGGVSAASLRNGVSSSSPCNLTLNFSILSFKPIDLIKNVRSFFSA